MNELQQTTSFLTPIEVELGVDENGMTTARKLYRTGTRSVFKMGEIKYYRKWICYRKWGLVGVRH